VASVAFSNAGDERVIHDLDDISSADFLLSTAPYLASETATAAAFKFVFSTFLNTSNPSAVGRRPWVPLHFVVLVDGVPSDAVRA